MSHQELYEPLLNVIEFLGTFAFAISGIVTQQPSISTGLADLSAALRLLLVAEHFAI